MVCRRYRKERSQMRNNIRCYNRDVELTERESRGWLNRPSVFLCLCVGVLSKTLPVKSPIWELIVCIGNKELPHGAQKCEDVAGDERKIGCLSCESSWMPLQRIWTLTKGKEQWKVFERNQIVLLKGELWQQYGKWTGRESMVAGRPVKKP